MSEKVFPAEWAPQSAIMLAWPHEETDWCDMLEEVRSCFSEIIHAISRFQDVLVLVHDEGELQALKGHFSPRVFFQVVPTNDTWARDFGPLFIYQDGKPVLMDFKFNGWGLKFGADKDNLINGTLFKRGVFHQEVTYCNRLNVVLEGGSLESDGAGTLLTTAECLLSPNRNGGWNQLQIETYLKENFGFNRVLWLNHGYLAGDDTDSHIDTLARLCDPETIAYVQCIDKKDEHYDALKKMEAELKQFVTVGGKPYRLIPLPMASPVYFEGDRLPATYANFLIINGAVLVPTYGAAPDEEALAALAPAFPDREIIGVDCSALIKQHGSLHCVTMQLPHGVLKQ
jgi:agmatine deiminase